MIRKDFDFSRVTDFELSELIAQRNIHQFAVSELDELINEIGKTRGFLESKTDKKETVIPPSHPKPSNLTEPNSSDFSALPWKSYKTKETAKPHESAWIFANTKGAEALLATLKAKDGQASIGSFDYQLQGEGKFIARKSVASEGLQF